MEILFIDLGIPATVEVTDLREIPPLLLKDFTVIPRQVSCLCEYVDSVVQVTDSSGHGFPKKELSSWRWDYVLKVLPELKNKSSRVGFILETFEMAKTTIRIIEKSLYKCGISQ